MSNSHESVRSQDVPPPELTPEGFIMENSRTRRGRGISLYEGLNIYGERNGISPNLIFGVYHYAKRWNLQTAPIGEPALRLLDDLHQVTDLPDFFKSRSFNYISEEEDPAVAFSRATHNARYLIGLVGQDFFASKDKERATIFKAPIADTNFFLSCKGGSGAGTFSLDFAIGIDWGQPFILPSGELWRTGIDTETEQPAGAFTTRIIRTGSGVKKDIDKIKAYPEFRKKFKISPQRALAFLSMYVAHSLGADELRALSTQGALRLSSLSRSKDPYDYTNLFSEIGLQEGENPNWLSVPDLQTNFYPTIETSPDNQNGLRAHETRGMHHILEAFQGLRDSDGNDLPIKLRIDESREEIEKVLITFEKIHGWRSGHKS